MINLWPTFNDLPGAGQVALIVAGFFGLCWLGLEVWLKWLAVWDRLNHWKTFQNRMEKVTQNIKRTKDPIRSEAHIKRWEDQLNLRVSHPRRGTKEGGQNIEDTEKQRIKAKWAAGIRKYPEELLPRPPIFDLIRWDNVLQEYRQPRTLEERAQWEKDWRAMQSSPRRGDSDVDTGAESQHDGGK